MGGGRYLDGRGHQVADKAEEHGIFVALTDEGGPGQRHTRSLERKGEKTKDVNLKIRAD